jgi:LacI family transcriptional regulator
MTTSHPAAPPVSAQMAAGGHGEPLHGLQRAGEADSIATDRGTGRRPGAGRPVTLRHVAALAGVHPATVSRALSPGTRHLVKTGTVDVVIAAARELGYVPNRAAASLRTHRTLTVGALAPDLADPAGALMIRGAEEVLSAAGYMLLAASVGAGRAREREALRGMMGRGADGLILAGHTSRPSLTADVVSAGLPAVVAGHIPGDLGLPYAVADWAQAARMIVAHLAGLGHRRAACITGPGGLLSQPDILAAAAAGGLAIPSSLTVTAQAATVEEGQRCCHRLLAASVPFTAIITGADLLAAGCCAALASAGRACPGVSVTGAGDLPLAGSLSPALTTIAAPQHHVGAAAAHLLLAALLTARPTAEAQHLAAELIARPSTAAPSRGPAITGMQVAPAGNAPGAEVIRPAW